MTKVFVAAGSNVEPESNLARACGEVARHWPDATFSRAFRNQAVGFDGPDFINMVVGFETAETIDAVLAKLHAIEESCGRPRFAPKWAPRAMDLDILLFGERIGKTDKYTLPRPDLLKRAFMLGPMAELAPDVIHPVEKRSIRELWEAFDRDGHAMTPVEIGLPGQGS
jgi:2-amino-4-hydroxy-6-hydroxymethyldihydropteridine diphosphokinase